MNEPKYTVSQSHSGSGDNVAGDKNEQQEILEFLESIVNQHNKTTIPQKGRIAGLYQGQGWISDDFNEPLSDEFFSET